MTSEVLDAIYHSYDTENWTEAKKLLRKELRKEPDDHWYLTRLSSVYYEEYNYKKALEISERALAIAPSCPLVLWDIAGAYYMLNQYQKAEDICKQLLKKGWRAIAFGECGEGKRWACALLNDCRYTLALIYRQTGDFTKAIRYMQIHLRKRAPGLPSVLTYKEAVRFLKTLRELADAR